MKKISYIELSSMFLTIIIALNTGINIYILKQSAGINSWIAVIISYIIGIIPLLLTLYIANYHEELNIFEKNKHLFGDYIGIIINSFISIILFIIAMTILYNIVSFINTQFLYRTPIIISIILLVALAIYCSIKEINVISHISIILMVINIFMFILSNASLINEIKLDNLLPILKISTNNLLMSSIKIAIINILPIITILIIPKDKITNKTKYNKSIIITYIIGFIISMITIIGTIGTLSIYLTNTFEFAEYMVLKNIKLFGFLERTENIIATSYITESYIYLTLLIYSISKNFPRKNDKSFKYTNILIGIVLILTTNYIFKNITHFNNYVENNFIYIVSLLIIPYIIISCKIFIENKCQLSK